jgi:dTDP-4-amino-4,6-dideoxygalactose transaminase
VTESEAARCLALPFFNQLQDAEITEVCETLRELIADAGKHIPHARATSAG